MKQWNFQVFKMPQPNGDNKEIAIVWQEKDGIHEVHLTNEEAANVVFKVWHALKP